MARPATARPLALLSAALVGVLAVACGGTTDGSSGLPKNTWTFVTVDGAVCSDGSPTGIAVNPGAREDVVVFLDGGGACIDYATCFVFKTASPGPFGAKEFQERAKVFPGSAFDRDAPTNPFRDWTYVFVPYCTGDVHVGDLVASYPDQTLKTHDYHHVGRANLEKDVAKLRDLLPAPGKLVVSGASAGGYGASLNYPLLRGTWPAAKGYLVDDSGPLLVGEDLPVIVKATAAAAWRADEVLLPLCGAECFDDWSKAYVAVHDAFPDDRIALLSTLQDEVIRAFLQLDPAAYEAAVLRIRTQVFDPLPNSETFLAPGTTHTFLGDPQGASAGGVTLEEWLRRMVEDDPAWASAGP